MKKYFINGGEVEASEFVNRYINLKTITSKDTLLLAYLHHTLISSKPSEEVSQILSAVHADVIDLDFKVLTQNEILGNIFEVISIKDEQPQETVAE